MKLCSPWLLLIKLKSIYAMGHSAYLLKHGAGTTIPC
jgi:hypothetical protein